MASFKYEFGDVDKLFTNISVAASKASDEVLKAGAEVIKQFMVNSASAAGYIAPGTTGRGTGRMIESIGYDKIKTSGDSKSVDIYPLGIHHKKERNARVAFVLNYGRTNMKGSHWIDSIKDDSHDAAVAAMTKKFNDMISK